MKKIVLSVLAAMCLSGAGSLSFADEMGKMKREMKGKTDETKMKGEGMKGEMKGTANEMKGKMGEMGK